MAYLVSSLKALRLGIAMPFVALGTMVFKIGEKLLGGSVVCDIEHEHPEPCSTHLKIRSMDDNVVAICITIANMFWFGMFFAGMWFFGWPWFSMLVPLVFHWNRRDYGVFECDHE